MEIMKLIEELADVVEKSFGVAFTGKVMVDKDEVLDILQDMRLKLPENIKEAKWIKEERGRIIAEAQQEAEKIIKSAEDKIINMIDESEITRRATEQAEQILAHAQERAKDIRNGTREYTDNMLASLEKNLNDYLRIVEENRAEYRNQGAIIEDNK